MAPRAPRKSPGVTPASTTASATASAVAPASTKPRETKASTAPPRLQRAARRRALPGQAPHRWDDIRLLLEVARAGSFTQAARRLGVEQSTVSRRIAALEESVGGLIFDREPGAAGHTGRGITPFGERLILRAEQVEEGVLAFDDEASGHEVAVKGRVRLALTESMAIHIVLPSLLPLLRQRHPELHVDLLTGDTTADLGHREAEIAIRFFRPPTGALIAKRVARLSTAVIAHRSFKRTRGSELPWVNVELRGIQTPEQLWLQRHVQRPPRLITNSYLTQIEAVRAGVGAALLTRSVLLLDAQLAELELELPAGPILELWLVSPASLRKVPRVAAVWDALEPALSALDS